MIINHSSRILLNILLPGFGFFLKTNYKSGNFAVSALMEHSEEFFDYAFLRGLKISSGKFSFIVYMYYNNINDSDTQKIIEYINNNTYSIKLILSFIFKRNFNAVLLTDDPGSKKEAQFRIDISFNAGNSDSYLTILIPSEFFILFSNENLFSNGQDKPNIYSDKPNIYSDKPNIYSDKPNIFSDKPNIDIIERSITGFFTNPENLFPDLRTVFNSLSETDIQRLFYHLQKKNLLTPYQISLMLMSVPQHTVLIKRNLSSNIVKDVDNLIKKMNINKRDLIGGVYSIEEAIYMLMKDNEDFHYSGFFTEIKNRLRLFLNSRSLISMDFHKLINDMNRNDLYQVLSISRDEDIINSISDNPDMYYDILSKTVSERKVKDLYSVFGQKKISFIARTESQVNMISHYKKIRIKRLNLGHDNFSALLSKIDRNEIVHLLLGVGWFVLSTALKKTDKKKAIHLIEKLPAGARYLVVDVLQGIVNPNIIHDEIQVNKARTACVNEMASLYEDGIIDLLP